MAQFKNNGKLKSKELCHVILTPKAEGSRKKYEYKD